LIIKFLKTAVTIPENTYIHKFMYTQSVYLWEIFFSVVFCKFFSAGNRTAAFKSVVCRYSDSQINQGLCEFTGVPYPSIPRVTVCWFCTKPIEPWVNCLCCLKNSWKVRRSVCLTVAVTLWSRDELLWDQSPSVCDGNRITKVGELTRNEVSGACRAPASHSRANFCIVTCICNCAL
jgi:hypothetical protein